MAVACARKTEADVTQLSILAPERVVAYCQTDEAQQRPQALQRLARLVHGDRMIAFLPKLGFGRDDLINGYAPDAFLERLTKLEAKGHAVSVIGCTRRDLRYGAVRTFEAT